MANYDGATMNPMAINALMPSEVRKDYVGMAMETDVPIEAPPATDGYELDPPPELIDAREQL